MMVYVTVIAKDNMADVTVVKVIIIVISPTIDSHSQPSFLYNARGWAALWLPTLALLRLMVGSSYALVSM